MSIHPPRRITDKLDLFALAVLAFTVLGSWVLPLTADQKTAAGGAFIGVLAFILRRWTAQLRANGGDKPENGSGG